MMLRRSFLSRFTAAAAVVGIGEAPPQKKAAPAKTPFQAGRYPLDDWMERPAKHRVVMDTWLSTFFGEAAMFAGNYLGASKNGYQLSADDLAMIVVVRHQTAPFAFNDAMWAKYGKQFSARMQFTDPKTKEVPTANVYSRQLTELVKQGVQFGVCSLTTRAYTRIIADQTGSTPEEVYKELTENTVGNAHFVPAGVVAVTRAQERGYVLLSIS